MVQERPGWQLPLSEASALCLRHDGARGAVQLLAVDDEAYALAVAEIEDGIVPPSTGVDVRAVVPDAESRRGGSDFEGVASDASRQVFVLQEGADRVLVFDERLTAVDRAITLCVPRDQPDFGSEWHGDDNARGEGLLLLRNGHILVGKQRKAPRLIEFGPPDDDPEGFAPGAGLRPDETFPLSDGDRIAFGVLASWLIDPDSRIESVNDLALDAGGALHLVSSKSRSLARLDGDLAPEGGTAALTPWQLPAHLFQTEDDKAEGLVFAPKLGWLVALDLEREAPNIFPVGGVPRLTQEGSDRR
jgi:hypothetical protein